MKPWMDRPFLANRLGGKEETKTVGWLLLGGVDPEKKTLRRLRFLFTKNMKVEKTLFFFGKLLTFVESNTLYSYCQ